MSQVKITKFVHSCVLIETDDCTILLDPGKYSWESGKFDINKLHKLDAVAITHEHQDHFSEEFVSVLIDKFPKVMVVATSPVEKILKDIFGEEINIGQHNCIEKFSSNHNKLPFDFPAPENTGYHVDGLFSHPGDSNTFNDTKAILAMPMTGPWGSMTESVARIQKLNPKVVLPIHDWHWQENALKDFYTTCESNFSKQGIRFIIPIDGRTELVKL